MTVSTERGSTRGWMRRMRPIAPTLFALAALLTARVSEAVCDNTAITSATVPQGGTTNSTSASFYFSPSPLCATLKCRITTPLFQSAPWESCSSPKSYTGLGDGTRTFNVVSCNTFGTCDPTPAMWTWTVDTTGPETTISSSPPSPSTSSTLSYSFTANEPTQRFDCSFDGSAWATCASPKNYTAADGVHEFRARAVDLAGNLDATPASAETLVNAVVCQ